MRFRSSEEPDIDIPVAFWKTLSSTEFYAFAKNGGYLNPEQCARLWQMTDRQDEPPRRLQILANAADVMREFPPR